jgi:hypothetical protein
VCEKEIEREIKCLLEIRESGRGWGERRKSEDASGVRALD